MEKCNARVMAAEGRKIEIMIMRSTEGMGVQSGGLRGRKSAQWRT